MNHTLIIGLTLTLLSSSAFALPSSAPFPLVGEALDSPFTPELQTARGS